MELVDKIRSGDKEAIKQVYKENSKEVLEFAESITGDHASALDVTKKTFVKLFSSIQGGQSPTNLRTAALKIAHDEACKVAMPSSNILTSPYEESESEIGKLEKTVGHDEKDEAMGETRVISLPQEAIDELVDDRSSAPAAIEEVGNEEVHGDATIKIPTDYVEKEEKRSRRKKKDYYEEEEYYDDDVDEYDDYDDDYYDKPKKRSKGVFVVCLIINIILILLLLWFVFGLLRNLSIIPDIDLGYSWFNDHIANIF